MPPASPSFYPPRAGPFKKSFRWRFRLRAHLESAERLTRLREIVVSLPPMLLPAYSYFSLGRKVGRFMAGSYLCCLLVFALFFGYPLGRWAFIGMLSLHASSASFFLGRRWPEIRLGVRVLLGLAMLALFSQLIYAPARQWIEGHWALPIQQARRVVVVRPGPVEHAARGTWIAYQVTGGGDGLFVREGYALSVIYGVGGDVVRFGTDSFAVAGKSFPMLPYMPRQTEWPIPAGHYFVWAEFKVAGGGHGPVPAQEAIARVYQANAVVPASQIVGRPFHRWFWRTQTAL